MQLAANRGFSQVFRSMILVMLAVAAMAPRVAHAANTCNAFVSIDYPSGPDFALPGDVYRVGLEIGTGSIVGGTQMQINRLRFELDCSTAGSLGIPCTDDGSLIEYEGDGTITTTCPGIVFTTGHAVSDNPNEVVFTPNVPIVIPANTPNFCRIEFNVKVLSISDPDPTPNKIEEVAGYQASTFDAQCNNGLQSSGSQSGSINLCPTCTDSACAAFVCNQQTGQCDRDPGNDPAASTPCPDTDQNACTTAGCNGLGNCNQGHIPTVCQPDTNECTNDPACDPQTGRCEHPPVPDSTPCTDADGNACTTAGCEAGSCTQTHVVTVCQPDTNECTDDPPCNTQTGQCEHPPMATSTPCTDTDADACTTAGCDGQGTCNQSHIVCVTTTTSTSSTTSTTLGCVPVAEICNNMIDDDCDGLIDCAEDQTGDPDCLPCPIFKKDPTDIRYTPGLDRLRSKGVLETPQIDLSKVDLSFLLTNPSKTLYSFTLHGSDLVPSGSVSRYRNPDARTTGGLYELKIKKQKGGFGYAVSTISYWDLSPATDARMRVQFYLGDIVFISIDTPWKPIPTGWRAPKDH